MEELFDLLSDQVKKEDNVYLQTGLAVLLLLGRLGYAHFAKTKVDEIENQAS